MQFHHNGLFSRKARPETPGRMIPSFKNNNQYSYKSFTTDKSKERGITGIQEYLYDGAAKCGILIGYAIGCKPRYPIPTSNQVVGPLLPVSLPLGGDRLTGRCHGAMTRLLVAEAFSRATRALALLARELLPSDDGAVLSRAIAAYGTWTSMSKSNVMMSSSMSIKPSMSKSSKHSMSKSSKSYWLPTLDSLTDCMAIRS